MTVEEWRAKYEARLKEKVPDLYYLFLKQASQAGWEAEVEDKGSEEEALKTDPSESADDEMSYWDNDE